MKAAALLILPLILISSLAQAETEKNRLSFQVEHSIEIPQDELVVLMYREEESVRQAEAANRVNQVVKQAQQSLKAFPSITVQNQSYRVYPVYQDGQIKRWRVRQTIRLSSRDLAGLSERLGALQQQLMLELARFQVAQKTLDELDESLNQDLLIKARQRAMALTETLGAKGFEWIRIDLQGGPSPIGPERLMVRSMAMADSAMTAPDLQAGQQKISVSARIEIELYQ